MAIIHYIDTSVSDISKARMFSLTNRIPISFPVLAYGDTRSHEFIFHYQGTVEPFSGNANYALRATIGDTDAGPTNGSYVLTFGTATPAIDSQSDAAAIAYALNALASVIAAGGVTVVGVFPSFLIAWNATGVQTALTVNSSLLLPISTATLSVIQTGDATHCQIYSFAMRQVPATQQATWSVTNSPSNGWIGTINTNTANLAQLMQQQSALQGQILQAQTLLTVEVLDTANSNAPTAYYQTPVVIRAKNLGS